MTSRDSLVPFLKRASGAVAIQRDRGRMIDKNLRNPAGFWRNSLREAAIATTL